MKTHVSSIYFELYKLFETVSLAHTFRYLTNGFLGVERFPLSFKSVFGGNVHRHVVLGIYYAGSYGTIGMSRREDLMYKPLTFKVRYLFIFDKNSVKMHTARVGES